MKIEDLMCGKVIAVIAFNAVTITEIYLSHQNGKDSGAASRSLSTHIHISEKMLRTSAHMIFFAVITFLLCLVCQMYQLRMITSLFVAVWAVMDEVTKPMMKNGRHCSKKDIGWNLLGVGVEGCVGVIVLH